MKVRYIRDSMNGTTTGNGCQWVEVKAIDYNGNNVALNKTVTGSFVPSTGSFSLVTNGIVSDLTVEYVGYQNSEASSQHIQIDLGQIYDIKAIEKYHYVDNRIYKNMKVEVSENGTTWTTVFDSEVDGRYQSTINGKTILLKLPSNATLNEITSCNDGIKLSLDLLRNTMKQELTKLGVSVASNEGLESMINKISSISVGKKWAEGSFSSFTFSNTTNAKKTISMSLDFVPSRIVIYLQHAYIYDKSNGPSNVSVDSKYCYDSANYFGSNGTNTIYAMSLFIDNIKQNSFDFNYRKLNSSSSYTGNIGSGYWVAYE